MFDRTYPLGTQDMQPILKDARATAPTPSSPSAIRPTRSRSPTQSRVLSFNPKVFFTGVGAAFPLYKQRFGANAEGVMGIGGWNADSPALKAYFKRHAEVIGREPDRWASPITYVSLQVLQQAIERVGKLDRAAIIKEIQTGTFETIIGEIKLEDDSCRSSGGSASGRAASSSASRRPATKAQGAVLPKPAWEVSGSEPGRRGGTAAMATCCSSTS